jgi:hypothetical protein
MRNLKTILVTLISSFLAISCSKSNDTPTPSTEEAPYTYTSNIYIAGVYDNKAVFWKNGVKTILSASTRYAQATAVFVSGSDVYTAGIENKESGVAGEGLFNKGKIWKNGTSLYTLAYVDCNVNDVAVINNDVYAVGKRQIADFDYFIPTIWKNGNPINLQIKNRDCDVVALEIKNNTVYCVGYTDDGTRNIATMWSFNIANNQVSKNEYASPNLDSKLIDVCFDPSNNIYVTGIDFDGMGDGYEKPFFRKNNAAKQNLTMTSTSGKPVGIHATENKTIVSGWQEHPTLSLRQPCLWENVAQTLLFPSEDLDYLLTNEHPPVKSFLFQEKLFQCGTKVDTQASAPVDFIPIFFDGNRRITVEKLDKDAQAFGIYVTTL